MQELDDNALLQEYAEKGCEEAFATLVARHVDRVYSVALRHTRNPDQAEEITQAVFVILAKKSRHLNDRVVLSGWLYQTARLTAMTLTRSELRRARRDHEAHMQTLPNEPERDVWHQIAPLLDAAMAGLSEMDRHAVVLRFFDGKSMREVGAALGGSEDAAKMRVNRAVEKLRCFFTKRGVVLSGAVLTAVISAKSVQAAPVLLAKSVTVVAFMKGAAPGSSTPLVKGALKVMAWTKAKTSVVAGIVVLLVAGSATVTVNDIREHKKNSQIAAALLTFHQDWASNGYHSTHKPLPKILAEEGEVRAWSAGILGAYVDYSFKKDGTEWRRMFHILRVDTNTSTWTLSEFVRPADTNFSRMARERILTTVTDEP